MNMSAPAAVFPSTVMHSRRFPVSYRFSYRVFSVLVDVDRLAEIGLNPLFSIDRFNLFSLHLRDHGAHDGSAWRGWAETVLRDNGIDGALGNIQLLCLPRILGYGFNPLSLWFCHNPEGELLAVIGEVSNTFGEHHHYLLNAPADTSAPVVTGSKQKVFHVSPFIGMDARYEFFIHPPGDTLNIVIHEYAGDELMLIASQRGERLPFSTAVLLRQFALVPFMTLKVMSLIHWHALKIWLKGGKLYSKPAPPTETVT